MNKYAIIGWPLKHSLSPEIHNPAFKKLAINALYEKVEINPENFENEIQNLRTKNYCGFNITIPHKNRIIPFLNNINEQAKVVGAVNTVCVNSKSGDWFGYNTDIDGFITPLLNLKRQFNNFLILGTGGAARTILYAILKFLSPQKVVLAGRNRDKTNTLREEFLFLIKNTEFSTCLIKNIDVKKIKPDLIINATPVGTIPNVKESPLPQLENLKNNTVVYDLVYNPQNTQLLIDAKKAGKNIITINGVEMLIGQAAKSFKLWTGKEMPIDTARANLLRILSK